VNKNFLRRVGHLFVALLAGAIMAAAGATEANAARQAQLEGKPAPALQLINWLNGDAVTLAELKGKVVVLDFWATWCRPCIADIPRNNALAEKYRDQGVVVLGVCHPMGMEKMDAVVLTKGMKYPTAQDSHGATTKAYAVESLPESYVIDRKGVLRAANCPRSRIERVIESLLKEP